MGEITCNSCLYYRQHYVLDQRKILRIYCGHCTYARIKTKRPNSKVCEHYVYTSPDETAFVTKEYLSKKLLEYMLSLELLPEITDLQNTSNKIDHSNTTNNR